MNIAPPPKIGFVSLGCPKATVDSEHILTRLRAEGYQVAPSYAEAQLVVVNTCGFIDAAVEESLEAIGEALDENGKVIVTGCLGAKPGVVETAYPNVLAVTGPQATDEVLAAVHRHLPAPHDPFTSLVPPQGVRLTPRHYAYLKIAEGCNQQCSFCIIPSMRGRLRSRPMEEVLDEAERLVASGVRELLVIAQDTAAYGVDTRYRNLFWNNQPLGTRITDLAQVLGGMGVWVRLHYLYPYPHIDNLLPMMADGRVLPYLDIPMQHASPTILKAMRRPADSENMLERIRHWREVCPDITLRSTFIVGFPGETEADFETLLSFLEQAQLDRVGCFSYSPVEGAPANDLAGHVPESLRQERLARLMAVQQEISEARLGEKVAKEITVLVDRIDEEGACARSSADAPEIHGLVFIEEPGDMQVGEFYQVRVLDAGEHDLWAERLAQ